MPSSYRCSRHGKIQLVLRWINNEKGEEGRALRGTKLCNENTWRHVWTFFRRKQVFSFFLAAALVAVNYTRNPGANIIILFFPFFVFAMCSLQKQSRVVQPVCDEAPNVDLTRAQRKKAPNQQLDLSFCELIFCSVLMHSSKKWDFYQQSRLLWSWSNGFWYCNDSVVSQNS